MYLSPSGWLFGFTHTLIHRFRSPSYYSDSYRAIKFVAPNQTPEDNSVQTIVTHIQETALPLEHSHRKTHDGIFILWYEVM